MPSYGSSDEDAARPGGSTSTGRTAYQPLNRGRHLPGGPAGPWVHAPLATGSPHAGNLPAAPAVADQPAFADGHAPMDEPAFGHEPAFSPEPALANEPATGGIPTVRVPAQAGPHGRRGPASFPPGSPAGQGPPSPPPPLPGAPGEAPAGERPRRRWLLAGVAAVAVLVGASAAVVANGDGDKKPGETLSGAQDPPTAAAQPAPAPTVTPSGVAGLGPNPAKSAAPTSTPGFRPFSAPRRTLPGASLHLLGGESFADALRRSDRTFGPLRMVRVFYPGLPPSWKGSRADVANRTVVVSFKAPPKEVSAGKHDGRLAGWFASVPKDVDVYWSYFHEPENDVQRGSYTPAQFAAAFRHVSGLADRARNPRLRATLILMCWTLNPNSGRDFDAYYPGSAAVDVLGWDCYNSGQARRYTPPAEVFSRMISKSKALGKPWGLAETGSVRGTSDKTGAGRAAWIRAMSRYLNDQKPLWVAYYDYQVSGGDFRLTDAPSREAWKAWCSASPA